MLTRFKMTTMHSLKYEHMKLSHALFSIDAKYKKDKQNKEPQLDLDHEDDLKVKELEQAEKVKEDNEKDS